MQEDIQDANHGDFPWFISRGIILSRIVPKKEREEFLKVVDILRTAERVYLLVKKILRKEEELSQRSFLVRQFKRQYGHDSTFNLIREFIKQLNLFEKLVGPEFLAEIGIDTNHPKSIFAHLEEIGKAAVAIAREATETNYLMSISHPAA